MSAEASNLKNALVASLFELANAAQNTATATVNFFNHHKVSDSDAPATLKNLAEALKLTQPALTDATTAATNATESFKKPTSTKKVSKDSAKAGQSDDPVEAPVEAPLDAAALKKKKAAEKDPNAPKKPLTMYFAYSHDAREKIKEERKKKNLEPLSAIDMNVIIKEKWASITPAERDSWQKKYKSQYVDYQKEKKDYDEQKQSNEPNGAADPVSTPASSQAETPAKSPVVIATPAKLPAATPSSRKTKAHVEPEAFQDSQEVLDISDDAEEAVEATPSSKKSKKRNADKSEKKSKKSKKSSTQGV